jgi:hypothetical protein
LHLEQCLWGTSSSEGVLPQRAHRCGSDGVRGSVLFMLCRAGFLGAFLWVWLLLSCHACCCVCNVAVSQGTV